MNVLHMKYAVEVARAGSINKAAKQLYIAQPNLSRCIKELEADLGIVIFDRTFSGMKLTPDGEEFIHYAQKVLHQIDDIEHMYKNGVQVKQRFSISVPRASYISDAFARFTKSIDASPAEVFYMETNSSTAINNIINSDYRLGIIRYAANYDKYFKEMLENNGLAYEVVAEFKYVLIMSRECALAAKPKITFKDLHDLIEIVHGDPYVPSLPLSVVKKEEMQEEIERRILLFERGGQFDVLIENPETFMWVSPIPQKLLDRDGLVQRECVDNQKKYKDVLIRKKEYSLSELDQQFIKELFDSKQIVL
ncbi:MAG: LysR family transcriptional regulator [Lachnospiraceae bacterium]|nr:LysR family transcriptional regulator [Lachnospiraceae bacterium]